MMSRDRIMIGPCGNCFPGIIIYPGPSRRPAAKQQWLVIVVLLNGESGLRESLWLADYIDLNIGYVSCI